MRQESNKFIDLLAKRDYPQKTMINPYNQEHWFEGAYRTVQRGISKGTLSAAKKGECARFIFQELRTLKPITFDDDMRILVTRVGDDFPVSIGQAQKLVNILLKYHACLYYSDYVDANWKHANPWVADIHKFQHVPIDSIVLFGLCRNDPDSCAQYVTASSSFAYSKVVGRFVWNYAAYIYVQPYKDKYGKKVPWSEIEDYSAYFHLQEMIRLLADTMNMSPLLYEMKCLWAPA